MSISAVVDGNTYNGITAISTGGKTISLSESGGSGYIKYATGEFVLSGITTYNMPFTINEPEMAGCTSFFLKLQVIETGLLATPGDPTSAVTMYENPRSDVNTQQIFAYGNIYTGAFFTRENIVYPTVQYESNNAIITTMSVELMNQNARACTISDNGSGLLTISIPSTNVSRNNLYMKFKYTIYGM